MNIIFEKTSAPETYGGNVRSLAPHHALKMQRDLLTERSSAHGQRSHGPAARNDHALFDPLGPALEHREPLQTFIDIAAVLFGFLFASLVGLAVVYAFAVCLFLSVT